MNSSVVARLECVADRMEKALLKYEMRGDQSEENKQMEDGFNNVIHSPTVTFSTHLTPKRVQLLDLAILGDLNKFYELSLQIGGDVNVITEMSKKAFEAHRRFVWISSGREKPVGAEFMELISDLSSKIEKIGDLKEKNRSSSFFDQICALDAAVFGLGWVAQPATPASFVKEALDTSMFYINRILVAYKDKSCSHLEWARTLKDVLNKLHAYVLKNHTSGLVWNSDPGAKPVEAVSEINVSSGIAPPPPPPPPPAPTQSAHLSSQFVQKQPNVSALLASLNTGLAATSRLRKITPEMQTHKNRSLRDESIQKCAKIKNTHAVDAESSNNSNPCVVWDGKIWKVDFQMGNKDVIVTVTGKKESIYIYKCVDSIVKINGKANAITLDGCKRTSVVFDGLVAQCEIINSQSVKIQTLGELPTVSIQKTDGCHIFLSPQSLTAQIISSKSSEMTVSALLDANDDEYTEMAIPEQFMTSIFGKKLVTVASEII